MEVQEIWVIKYFAYDSLYDTNFWVKYYNTKEKAEEEYKKMLLKELGAYNKSLVKNYENKTSNEIKEKINEIIKEGDYFEFECDLEKIDSTNII